MGVLPLCHSLAELRLAVLAAARPVATAHEEVVVAVCDTLITKGETKCRYIYICVETARGGGQGCPAPKSAAPSNEGRGRGGRSEFAAPEARRGAEAISHGALRARKGMGTGWIRREGGAAQQEACGARVPRLSCTA